MYMYTYMYMYMCIYIYIYISNTYIHTTTGRPPKGIDLQGFPGQGLLQASNNNSYDL